MKYEVFDICGDLETPIALIFLSERGTVTCTRRAFDRILDDVYVDGCDRSAGEKFLKALPVYFAGSTIALRIPQ